MVPLIAAPLRLRRPPSPKLRPPPVTCGSPSRSLPARLPLSVFGVAVALGDLCAPCMNVAGGKGEFSEVQAEFGSPISTLKLVSELGSFLQIRPRIGQRVRTSGRIRPSLAPIRVQFRPQICGTETRRIRPSSAPKIWPRFGQRLPTSCLELGQPFYQTRPVAALSGPVSTELGPTSAEFVARESGNYGVNAGPK